MLSPAPTPTIVNQAPARSVARTSQTATYGELIARVTTAVAAARLASTGPFASPAAAHIELLGYERFFRVAGAHLQFLAVLGRSSAGPLGKLANYLATLDEADAGVAPGGRWYQAATLLGAAHDVLATHLQIAPDGGLLSRTPQAEEQLDPRAAEHAGRKVAELVLTATSSRRLLVAAALRSQHRLPHQERPIATGHVNHLAKTVSTVEVYTMAALWDHHDVTGTGDGSVRRATLEGLEPATHVVLGPHSLVFRHTLDALKVLRQISYRQAHGISAASPASLRDLALLGAHFTEHIELPEPRTALQRVQRAHALDSLDAAHRAWTNASRDLTTVIRGLTKAPAAYGTAAHRLLQADPSDPKLRAAMLAALPRLGREAADNITELGRTGALLGTQEDLSLRRTWQPLPDPAVAELGDRFRTAGRATALARHAERQLIRQQAPSTAECAPVPARSRELVRGAHR